VGGHLLKRGWGKPSQRKPLLPLFHPPGGGRGGGGGVGETLTSGQLEKLANTSEKNGQKNYQPQRENKRGSVKKTLLS